MQIRSIGWSKATPGTVTVGIITAGSQQSWSGIEILTASAGDVIMCNPGEVRDGIPLEEAVREWHMLYFDPNLLLRELEEVTAGPPSLFAQQRGTLCSERG
ncbi:MAG TPA: AraC family ligand binding domain-containing protein [Terriglobales bacterium]|nr:AraC family ligand binding domain-containing protein [Terriglobales bacterium]